MYNTSKALTRTGWPLLREQKFLLISVINNEVISPSEKEAIEGILCLIDALQDAVVEDGLVAKDVVFESAPDFTHYELARDWEQEDNFDPEFDYTHKIDAPPDASHNFVMSIYETRSSNMVWEYQYLNQSTAEEDWKLFEAAMRKKKEGIRN